jgi:hypothetical protein
VFVFTVVLKKPSDDASLETRARRGDRSRRNSIAMSIMSYNGAAIIGTAGSREIRRAAVPFSGTIEPARRASTRI